MPTVWTAADWAAAGGAFVDNAVELDPGSVVVGEARGGEPVGARVKESANPGELVISAGAFALTLPFPEG